MLCPWLRSGSVNVRLVAGRKVRNMPQIRAAAARKNTTWADKII